MPKQNKILVIKLSALGDFVQALGAMKAIREHHPDSHISLLTTKPYVELALKSHYFNEIIVDKRPKLFQMRTWFNLAKKLNDSKFTRVYDLQCNDRTSIYFKLFLKKPEWVGTVKGASHCNINENKENNLAFDRHQHTLALADIKDIKIDDMKWIETDISNFNLKEPYVLITAGSAPSRPEKRWSASKYASLCKALISKELQPILLGTILEKDITEEIKTLCPEAQNLTGKTNLFDLVSLARNAEMAIGNDTGPMHFIGPTGCKTIVLFSGSSNPKCHRPLGKNVHTLQKKDINDISVDEVLKTIF